MKRKIVNKKIKGGLDDKKLKICQVVKVNLDLFRELYNLADSIKITPTNVTRGLLVIANTSSQVLNEAELGKEAGERNQIVTNLGFLLKFLEDHSIKLRYEETKLVTVEVESTNASSFSLFGKKEGYN